MILRIMEKTKALPFHNSTFPCKVAIIYLCRSWALPTGLVLGHYPSKLAVALRGSLYLSFCFLSYFSFSQGRLWHELPTVEWGFPVHGSLWGTADGLTCSVRIVFCFLTFLLFLFEVSFQFLPTNVAFYFVICLKTCSFVFLFVCVTSSIFFRI